MRRRITLLINGMIYGDGYTKRMLWGIFLASVGIFTFLFLGIGLGSLPLCGISMVLAGVDAWLIHSIEIGVGTTSDDAQEEKSEDMEMEQFSEHVQEPLILDDMKEESVVTEAKDVMKKTDEEKAEKKKIKVEEKEEKEPEKKEPNTVKSLEEYDEKELKKAFHKYKVKKNHRPILIDHCNSMKIKECPAYVWTHRGSFNILLLEESPRKLSVGMDVVRRMYYEKEFPADQRKEYDCLVGAGLIPLVFNEYKPIYYSVSAGKHQQEVKNLYRLGKDLYITATSAKEIMVLVQPDFVVEDPVMKSEEYNQYFKQIYKLKILLTDGVVGTKEYQGRVKSVLQNLAEAAITPAAFRMTLTDMYQRQLISSEYVSYYTQYNRQYRERHHGKEK